MSSSFHTLEEGMKSTLYLMFLQEPFAFPTSCSLQPLRLRGGRSPLPPGAEETAEPRAALLRGRSANAGPAACLALPCLASSVQNTTGLGERGRCAPAQATSWELRAPLAPAPSSDARGKWMSPGRELPRTERQGAKETLN